MDTFPDQLLKERVPGNHISRLNWLRVSHRAFSCRNAEIRHLLVSGGILSLIIAMLNVVWPRFEKRGWSPRRRFRGRVFRPEPVPFRVKSNFPGNQFLFSSPIY